MTEYEAFVGAVSPEIQVAAEGSDRIHQQVWLVLATRKGTQPLDRDFGLSFTYLDEPLEAAIAALTSEIYAQLAKYVPRAEVTSIEFVADPDEALEGRLYPRVWYTEIDS